MEEPKKSGWPIHLILLCGLFRNRPYMGYRDPDIENAHLICAFIISLKAYVNSIV